MFWRYSYLEQFSIMRFWIAEDYDFHKFSGRGAIMKSEVEKEILHDAIKCKCERRLIPRNWFITLLAPDHSLEGFGKGFGEGI